MKTKLFNFARIDKKDKVKRCCKGGIIILVLFFFNISSSLFAQGIIDPRPTKPIIPYNSFIQRNDTMFRVHIYFFGGKDSTILCKPFATKLTKSKWTINENEHGLYTIVKFKKVKPSAWWYRKYNGKFFEADFQCKQIGAKKTFYPDGCILIERPIFFFWQRGPKNIRVVCPKAKK